VQCHCQHGLRVRNVGRTAARGAEHRLGKAGLAGRGCAYRLVRVAGDRVITYRPRPRPFPVLGREPFALPEMLQGMVDRMRAAAAEPFVGAPADGNVEAGLFHLAPTGVSTEPLRRAARDLLAALDAEQRASLSFPLETDAWRTWSNISPFLLRHGLLLETL